MAYPYFVLLSNSSKYTLQVHSYTLPTELIRPVMDCTTSERSERCEQTAHSGTTATRKSNGVLQ